MAETGLAEQTTGAPTAAFDAAEESFFQRGDALERNPELVLDEELPPRRPRFAAWRPRAMMVGCACLALLAASLIAGKDPPGASIGAVPVAVAAPPPALPAAPQPAPAPAPVIAAAPEAPAPTVRARRSGKVKAKKSDPAKQRRRAR